MKLAALHAFRCAALGIALALTAAPLRGQAFSTSVYLGGGPERNGLSAAAGLRLELAGTWGAYARVALRGVTSLCQTSLPPTCNYPDGGAQEYAIGMIRTVAGDPWQGSLRLGAGLLSWREGSDPFVDFTAEVHRPLSARTALLLGLNAVVAPGVERAPHGNDAIVPRRTVVFPNGILGLAFRVR